MTRPVLHERLLDALGALASDEEFSAAAFSLDLVLCFKSSDRSLTLSLSSGRLSEAPLTADADLTLSAPEATWDKALEEYPPPGYQSITALQRCSTGFLAEGDGLLLAQCLHALERLLEILRGDPAGLLPLTPVVRDPTLIQGRYVDVEDAAGRSCRLYYERSGNGPPILMLHTAGADSRQFHDLMSDSSLAQDWSLYAFDLPSHGRSFPVLGDEGRPWRLTQEQYASWCVSFIQQVIGQPPVVIGCSMGAAIAVVLAAQYVSQVRAVIALEAPDRSPGRRNAYLRHPKVNQAQYASSYVRGLMSPRSPVAKRRIACWIYGQGGFGVYDADLRFYSEEYDGTVLARQIDTSLVPVFLLTGEYDYSASPDSTQRLAEAIHGSVFVRMNGLGHFPMSENPDSFREYLIPVLAKLQQTAEPDQFIE